MLLSNESALVFASNPDMNMLISFTYKHFSSQIPLCVPLCFYSDYNHST